jgi:hypothetical protein
MFMTVTWLGPVAAACFGAWPRAGTTPTTSPSIKPVVISVRSLARIGVSPGMLGMLAFAA